MCTNAGNASGKSGGQAKPKMISPLEGLRENDRQFQQALQTAKEKKVAVLEYEGINGKVYKRWYNGATYSDRKPRNEVDIGGHGKYKRKGTYKAKFKAPKAWGKNYDFG